MNRRVLLIAVLLVTLALVLNNWWSSRRDKTVRERETAARHIPDYFLHDFSATTLDSAGQPAHRLTAERLLRYSDDGSMELTEPRLTLYTDGTDAPWQIDAAHGHVSGDGEQMRLDGGVRVSRDQNGARMELTTAELLLKPREHYAETDAPLTLIHPHGRLDAIGMRAHMKEERLVLLAQVRGNYVPQ